MWWLFLITYFVWVLNVMLVVYNKHQNDIYYDEIGIDKNPIFSLKNIIPRDVDSSKYSTW